MAISVNRVVRTSAAPPAAVLAYLLDFEHAVEWDAGTVSCTRLSGDGGVGTRYRNVSEFNGRPMELEYTVRAVGDDSVVIVGRAKGVESYDTVSVRPWGQGGTELTYDARFTLSGVLALAAPFLGRTFDRLADATAAELQKALDKLH